MLLAILIFFSLLIDDTAADVESCRLLCSFISDAWDGHTPTECGNDSLSLLAQLLNYID